MYTIIIAHECVIFVSSTFFDVKHSGYNLQWKIILFMASDTFIAVTLFNKWWFLTN